RGRGNLVYGQVGSHVFLLGAQTDTGNRLEPAVDDNTTDESDSTAEHCAGDLRHQRHTTHAPQTCRTENTGGNTAPGAAQAMQGPDPKHVVDLPAVLGQGERPDEQTASNQTGQ